MVDYRLAGDIAGRVVLRPRSQAGCLCGGSRRSDPDLSCHFSRDRRRNDGLGILSRETCESRAR